MLRYALISLFFVLTGIAYGRITNQSASDADIVCWGPSSKEICQDTNGHFVPTTDNNQDLGSSSLEWRNMYIDGTATIDVLTVDDSITVGGSSTFTVTGGTFTAIRINGIRYADQFAGANLGVKVNNAIADFGASPACGIIEIPNGTYTFSTTIDFGARQGCWLRGQSENATILLCDTTGACIKNSGTRGALGSFIKISDLSINPNLTAQTDGIQLTDVIKVEITRVQGASFRPGFVPLHVISSNAGELNSFNVIIHNNKFTQNLGDGLKIDGANTTGLAASVIRDNSFSSNVGYGIRADRATQLLISGNELQGNTTAHIWLNGASAVSIIGNYMETATTDNIVIGTSTASNAITVSGNLMDGGDYCVRLDAGLSNESVIITGNRCTNATNGYVLNRVLSGVIGPNFGSTATIISSNTVNGIFISSAGAVGISTSGPSGLFSIGNSTLVVTSAGNSGFGTATPALTVDVVGSAQFGSSTVKSTFTAAGYLRVPSRTAAQINVLDPGDVGEQVICSNCAVANRLCYSTGTAVAQFASSDDPAVGCGTGN